MANKALNLFRYGEDVFLILRKGKSFTLFLSMGLFLSAMVSCVEAPKNSTPIQSTSPTTSDSGNPIPEGTTSSSTELITGTPKSIALQGVLYEFTPTSIEEGTIFVGDNLPGWLKVNASTGVLSGYPSEMETHNNISIIATKGQSYTQIGPFSLKVIGDPLAPYQWHLLNEGQTNFSQSAGVAGNDLSLSNAYNDNITGLGVTIAVSDSGLSLIHEDLDDNLFSFHKDYYLDSPFIGSPEPENSTGDHGTSVAGIIAAEGWNSVGIRGVAPGSAVAGLRYVGSSADTERTLDQAQGPYDIFNYSYGYSYANYNFPWDGMYQDQVLEGFVNGRNGLGQVYVKSAGNSYRECDFYYARYYNIEDVGVCFSHNANFDNDNVMIPMIVVGALNAKGQRSSYSSVGSNLWVSAFGGEFGEDEPAILTIDQVGCLDGYSRSNVTGTNFQKGELAINGDCDYTHTFNGTSSAAPMVTGVVALMLQANPNLTARDVKHILAVTADPVSDSSFDSGNPHENGDFFTLSGHTYEQGAVTNAAGFTFHNWHGFGVVNGDAAVAMAQSYFSTLGTLTHLNKDFDNSSFKVSPNTSIPDESASGVSSYLFVNNSITIEAVQIMINVTHGRPGDLGIELTSPSGTKSILLNINNSLLIPTDSSDSPVWVADLTDFVLSSNAFYGENSRGLWTLKVIDGLGGATGTEYDEASSQTGTLVDWSINISGH